MKDGNYELRAEIPGVDPAIKASYDKGVLTVSVPVTEVEAAEKHVAVEAPN